MSFIGKICPYCKTAFTAEDEIVVCSECEMPHHRDCWVENCGCTTFGCSGTIQSPNEQTAEITPRFGTFCGNCGRQLAAGDRFCGGCGHPVAARPVVPVPPRPQPAPSVQPSIPAATVPAASPIPAATVPAAPVVIAYNPNGEKPKPLDLPHHPVQTEPTPTVQPAIPAEPTPQRDDAFTSRVCRFVGQNSEYYLPVFAALRDGGKARWNTPPFFLTTLWLFYRKMYNLALPALVIEVVLNAVKGPIGILLGLAYKILLACYANTLYYRSFTELQERAAWLDDESAAQLYAKRGGTSILAPILACVGLIVFYAIVGS